MMLSDDGQVGGAGGFNASELDTELGVLQPGDDSLTTQDESMVTRPVARVQVPPNPCPPFVPPSPSSRPSCLTPPLPSQGPSLGSCSLPPSLPVSSPPLLEGSFLSDPTLLLPPPLLCFLLVALFVDELLAPHPTNVVLHSFLLLPSTPLSPFYFALCFRPAPFETHHFSLSTSTLSSHSPTL